MDSIASGYSQAAPVDTDVYEYRGDDFLPIDNNAAALLVCQEEFRLASSDSERLSLQGTGSQQSSLPQDFYRTSSQQSSLTSSSQRVTSGVSVVFLCHSNCQSQNMTGLLWHRNIMGFCVNRFTRGSHSICLLTGVMYVCFVEF
jgi:hypothetical protein